MIYPPPPFLPMHPVRYNERRQHQSLDYQTPAAVYFGTEEAHIIRS
jgi:hypothetical protein